jgi:hypothetical protein
MRNLTRSGFTLIEMILIPCIGLILVLIAGWLSNIIQICNMINDPITGMFVFKCVSVIVAPVGAVLGIYGWF